MKYIKLKMFIFSIFLFSTSSVYAYISWSNTIGLCAVVCDTPAENSVYPNSIVMFGTSVNTCENAAVSTCGYNNFQIDWGPGTQVFQEKFELREIITPDGDVLTGKDAEIYFQNRYPAKENKR